MGSYYKAEYIWIDGTEPTAKLRSKTKIVAEGREAADLGLRRLEHEPGARRELGLRAEAGVRLPGPDPRRRQQARAVRGAAHRHEAAPDATRAPPAPRRRRSTRRTTSGSASSRSTRSSRARSRSAGRTTASRRRRAATTAASAPTRSSAARSSRRTRTPASRPASQIAGTNGEVMPGQWEFQIGPVGPVEVLATTCGSRAGCSTASPRTSASTRRSTRSRCGATGTAPARTPTSRRRRCARATQPCVDGRRGAEARSTTCTSRTTATASRSASPASTRRRRTRSSATASATAARRCASRGRWPSTRRATSRTAARTRTWTRTSSRA